MGGKNQEMHGGTENPSCSPSNELGDMELVDQLARIASSPGEREGGWNSIHWPVVNRIRQQFDGDCDEYLDFVGLLLDHLIAARKDAQRWHYVRDVLARPMSPKMDGTSAYRFASVFGRGKTVEEVVDSAMEAERGCGA